MKKKIFKNKMKMAMRKSNLIVEMAEDIMDIAMKAKKLKRMKKMSNKIK